MFVLFRSTHNFRSTLGVFDTLEKAKKYERACLKCHRQGIYVYEIQEVGFNLLSN